MRDAHLYADLASIGQAQGYPVTASAVHLWTHWHLLPGQVDRRPGFGQRLTALHPDATGRLQAICRYRFDEGIARLEWIGALLWLDGEPISTGFIRDALRREVSRRRPKPLPSGDGDEVDHLAMKVSALDLVRDAMPNLSQAERDDVTLTVIEALKGTGSPTSATVQLFSRLTGLPRSRVRSELRKLSRPGIGNLVAAVEAPDDTYEIARERWRTDWATHRASRSAKSRVRVRKMLLEFLQCLGSVQIVPEDPDPGTAP